MQREAGAAEKKKWLNRKRERATIRYWERLGYSIGANTHQYRYYNDGFYLKWNEKDPNPNVYRGIDIQRLRKNDAAASRRLKKNRLISAINQSKILNKLT